MRQPVVIQISRDSVERGDCSRETALLNSFIPALCECHRNRVEFEVMGYLEDPREIYDVPEIRSYFQKLFTENPGLLFWINTETHMVALLAILLYPPVRVSGGIIISSKDMGQFIANGFMGLNRFCRQHSLDPGPTNAAVMAWTLRRSGK